VKRFEVMMHQPGDSDCKACRGRAKKHFGCEKKGVMHSVDEGDGEFWVRCDTCGLAPEEDLDEV